MIFQVEEIYSEAYEKFKGKKCKEIETLSKGDSYICINEIVENLISDNKPSLVLYGDYRPTENINKTNEIKGDITRVVYAGVIETTRKAAFIAVKSAKYLDDNYIVHIAGFGREEDVKDLLHLINEINNDLGYIGVQFDGSFTGDNLRKYLTEKDIGLSCHSYTKKELVSADVTFPSKIITYLNHGLKVVSPEIRCLTSSELKDFIEFYQGFDPESLAKGIYSVQKKAFKKEEVLNKIKELDYAFREEIKGLM